MPLRSGLAAPPTKDATQWRMTQAPAASGRFQYLDLHDAWRLADILLVNDPQTMEGLFQANNLIAPFVQWRSDMARLPAEELRRLAALWSSRRRAPLTPSIHSIDLDEVARDGDYVMAIDVLADGEDFHYRLYGQRIAEVTGFNMTDKLLSSVPTQSALAAFFLASYRAVTLSKLPLLTIHQPPSYAIYWTRLILPLVDASGAVTRILAGNVPHDRTPRYPAR